MYLQRCAMKSCRLALLVLLVAACARAPDFSDVTVFRNGNVITVDANSSIASSLAVRGGRIIAVATDDLVGRYPGAGIVDLDGKTMMPGFVDSHTHIGGQPQRYIDLTGTRSVAELVGLVSDKAEELGPDEWITGYGWSEDVMAEQRRPLRADLDAGAPDNPVMLTRAGGHSAVANSMALRLAGVDKETPQPEGGVIEYDESGELNGVIRERQEIVGFLIPKATDDEVRDSLIAMLKDQLRLGITSLTQAMDSIEHYAEWERVYAENPGQLPRARVQVFWEGPAKMQSFGKQTGDGDEFLQAGPIKIFVDGGFTGPAAYTKEPYRGEEEYRGKLSIEPGELSRIVRESHLAGWQLGIHAIGDAAIELVVDDLVAMLGEHPRGDHRHYLNHFTVMPSAETMDRMAANGIAITQQPNFTYTLEGRYVEYLDGARLQHNNPMRTPMRHGIHVALSSDVLPIGPMVGIYSAVTRKGMSGEVFGEEESLTVAEALRAYTIDSAWLSFEEDEKGSIEVGKMADLIVLDRNILNIDADDIMDTEVLQTWLGGTLVYARSPQSE